MRKLKNEELGRPSVDEFRASDKMPVIVVLDNVRSHLNVGSVFRTADGFAATGIYLCGITGTPPHRDIHKTALGATESVEWKYFPNTHDAITELKQSGYFIVAVEQAEGAVSLPHFLPQIENNYAIVFGNEVDGVDQAIVSMADVVLEIPQGGTKHSLNISVSAGIVLWETYRKLMLHIM